MKSKIFNYMYIIGMFFIVYIAIIAIEFVGKIILPKYPISIFFLKENPYIISSLGIVVYFFCGIKLFKNSSSFSKKKIMLVFFILFYLPVIIVGKYENILYSFSIISYLLALFFGLLLRDYNSIKPIKMISFIGFISLIFIMIKFIYPIQLQRTNFGNIDGKANIKINDNLIFFNKNDTIKILNDNKKYVIDFWNNGCSNCVKEFSKFKKISKKKTDKNTVFLTVNVFKIEDEINRSYEILNRNNHSDLNTYFINEKDLKDIKIKGFPKLIIIKNNTVIFDGYLDTLILFSKKYFN